MVVHAIPHRRLFAFQLLIISIFMLSLNAIAGAQIYYNPQRITSPNPSASDRFGNAVAMDNGVLVVGARLDDTDILNGGRVYVYNATNGALIRQLSGSNVSTGDEFGASVAIHNNFILVGSQYHTFGTARSGAAYFYDAATGAEIEFVGPSNAANNDWFGSSVAMNSVAALIGAPGTANPHNSRGAVFIFILSTQKELVKITPPAVLGDIRFGASVAINEDYIVIGAPGNSNPATPFPGEAFVYEFNTGNLTQLLSPDIPDPASQFGSKVAIDGDTIVVGAKTDDAFGTQAGAAYVFDASTGDQLARLSSPNINPGDQFGSAVAIKDGVIAVGASNETANATESGAVYVFDANTYELIDRVTPSQTVQRNLLGRAIAIDNGTIAAGAENSIPTDHTSGDVFLLNPFCRADLNLDGSLNFLDVSQFLDHHTDWNGDGSFNFLDISAFLASYADACSGM